MSMTPPREFDLGDLVNLYGEFKDSIGANIEPATVEFKVKDPAGAITTYTYGIDAEVVRDDVGRFHVGINASLSGWWYYKCFSTGVSQAAAERSFRVRESRF